MAPPAATEHVKTAPRVSRALSSCGSQEGRSAHNVHLSTLLFFAGKYTTALNQGTCTTWSSCAAGKYVSGGGSRSSNRVCSNCDAGRRSRNVNSIRFFLSPPPAAHAAAASMLAGKYTSSPNQGACAAWSSCAAGKYISNVGTTSSNRQCLNCDAGARRRCHGTPSTLPLPPLMSPLPHFPGKYTSQANQGSCTSWSSCAAGTFVNVDGTALRDRACADCNNGARGGFLIELHFLVHPSPDCSPLAALTQPGKYTSASNQGSCTAWSTCAAGKFVSDDGSRTSNRQCSDCSSGKASIVPILAPADLFTVGKVLIRSVSISLGKYTPSANQASCTTWSSCAPGTKVLQVPSALRDRTCTDCPAGAVAAVVEAVFMR